MINLLTSAFVIVSTWAGPASYAGYPKKDPAAAASFVDAIIEVQETPSDFQIAFSRTAPFYRFPKSANERMIKSFLREAQHARGQITVEFNPYTMEIYRMSSGK